MLALWIKSCILSPKCISNPNTVTAYSNRDSCCLWWSSPRLWLFTCSSTIRAWVHEWRLSRVLPPWGCVPASVSLLSVSLPASHGRSCFDSGWRTPSPAGLQEEHKGHRCETAHILWKRIMAIDDLLRARQDKNRALNDWGGFANLHYWPGDNNRHIKSLIGSGREYVNVTAQTVLLNKRLAGRRVLLWGAVTPKRLTQPSCPLQAERHRCTDSKTLDCYCMLRLSLTGRRLLNNV